MKHSTRSRLTALALATSAGLCFAACDPVAPQNTTGIPGIDKFAVSGSEPVHFVRSGLCTIFRPLENGTRRPAMAFGSGPGGGASYNGILTRVASFGTIAIATNGTATESGDEIVSCIQQLSSAAPDFNGRLAAAGHLQGGTGAINASRRVDSVEVTCPIAPFVTFPQPSTGRAIAGSADGPALIMCAGAETPSTCTGRGGGDALFQQAIVPITRVEVEGSNLTTPTGAGGLFAALVTTCVEAALGNDPQARTALRPGGLDGARMLLGVATRNQ